MDEALNFFWESIVEEFIQSALSESLATENIKKILVNFPTLEQEYYCLKKAFGMYVLLLINHLVVLGCAISENEEYFCCLLCILVFISSQSLRNSKSFKLKI